MKRASINDSKASSIRPTINKINSHETSMYKRFANDDEFVSEFHMTIV